MGLFILSRSGVEESAPAWFGDLVENEWTELAGGAAFSGAAWQKGATLASVQPTPYGYSASWDKNSIVIPWCGGFSDPTSGLYGKAAEGGHGDGSDNGLYGLQLKVPIPFWGKLWGPTAIEDISVSPLGSGSGGGSDANNAHAHVANDDGAPKTMHGWYRRVFAAGRVWLLATNEGGGAWTTDCWSIPYADLGPSVTDPSLWMYHGRIFPDIGAQSFGFQSGPSCYDADRNQILAAAEFAESNGVASIDCAAAVAAGNQSSAGNAVPGSTIYDVGFTGLGNSWSIVTNTDPPCWIAASPSTNTLRVWNLASPNGFREKTLDSGDLADTVFCGAGYYKGYALIGGPPTLTGSLRKLSIPSDPWNAETGFALSTHSVTGTLDVVEDFQGSFSQFQVIPDMGNGQGLAVIHCRDTALPTYVCKLPASL